ncbi:hypothetical protein AGMMS49959_07240 [Planctomycetales bacterium]|nr:hypothetical protein AGMMS49959_07240 [Planctomycetales bacterium]
MFNNAGGITGDVTNTLGTFTNSGAGTIGGSVTNDAAFINTGTALTIGSGQTFTNSATGTLTNTGTLNATSGVFTNEGTVDNSGTITTTAAAEFVNNKTLNLAEGSSIGNYTNSATGTTNVSGAVATFGLVANAGTLNVNVDLTASALATNKGTINLDGGVFKSSVALTNATETITDAKDGGTLKFNGGKLDVTAGVTLGVGSNTVIDLNKYSKDESMLVGTGTVTVGNATGGNAKVTLNGDKDGEYLLVGASTVTFAGDGYSLGNFENAIKENDTFATGYKFDAATGKLERGVIADGIRNAVRNDSLAGALIASRNALPDDVRAALAKVESEDSAAYRHATTALDGTNSVSGVAFTAQNAVNQSFSALIDHFHENVMAKIASGQHGSLLGNRASAGGKPFGMTGSGDAGHLTGFVKAYGGFGANGSTGSFNGYDFGGVGVLTGVGYRFANELELGALFGYSWNKAESYGNYGESTDNVIRLGVYGNYSYDNFFFNTSPTFGIHLINSERNIHNFGGQNFGTAKSDRTGYDFSWLNRLGYVFELPADFYLTPSYALAMSYFQDPSHSEHGAGGASARFGDYDQWSLLQTLELRLGKLFRVSDCFALLPEVWGGWEHDYINNNNTVGQSLGDFNYVANVRGLAQDRAVLGVGLTTIIQNKYEVFGRYDERLWDGGHASQFTVGLSVKF